MSSPEWRRDRETRRPVVVDQDRSDGPRRRREDDVEGPSRSSRHQASGRTLRQTPRSESTSQDPRRVLDNATSSPSSRRQSISSPKPGFASISRGDGGSSKPISIVNKGRSGYHEDGGNRRHRNEQVDHDAGSYNEPRSSGAEWNQEAEESTTNVDSIQQSYNEPPTEDSLSNQLGGMALGEDYYDRKFGHDEAYTFSASAPAGHGPGMSQHGHQRGFQVAKEALAAGLPNQDKEKGKAVVKDQQEDKTPPEKLRLIEGTPGFVEDLDPSYAMRNHDWKKFFRPGRVFLTLWTDPYAGETNTRNESAHDQFMSQVYVVKHNQKVFSKIRRFVVLRLGDRFCTCLPVTTYGGRGYRKGGINLNEHGLIFSETMPNKVVGIKKEALWVKISKNAEKLADNSYINYGRVYTVECNVKVKDVGQLDAYSLKMLRKYYNEIHHAPEDSPNEGDYNTTSQGDFEFTGVGAGFSGDQQGYGEHSAAPGRMHSSGSGATTSHDVFNDPNRQPYSNVNTQSYQQVVQPIEHLQQGGVNQNNAHEQNPHSSQQMGTVQYGSGYGANQWISPQGSQFSPPSQPGGFQDSMTQGVPGQQYQSFQVNYGSQLPTSHPTPVSFQGPNSSNQYYQESQPFGSYPQQQLHTGYFQSSGMSDVPFHPNVNIAPPIVTTPHHPHSGDSGLYPSHDSSMDPHLPPSGQHEHSSRGYPQHVIPEEEELDLLDSTENMRHRRNSTVEPSRPPHDPRSSRNRNRNRGNDHGSSKSGKGGSKR